MGMQRYAEGSDETTSERLLDSSVAGIALGFNLHFPEGTVEGEGLVVESLSRNFAVDVILRGRF